MSIPAKLSSRYAVAFTAFMIVCSKLPVTLLLYLQCLHVVHITVCVCDAVGGGGWLMEYYLHSCSSFSVKTKYDQYLHTQNIEQKRLLWQEVVEKCKSHFSGWLLFHVNSVGACGRRQMFYVTFVDHFFGLSRNGIELNSSLGYGVKLNMYDTERKRHEELSKEKTQVIIRDKPYVAWWDNFSKFHRRTVPTLTNDVFSSCLWTGVTVNEYTGPPVNVGIRLGDNNEVIPAMPDDLFAVMPLVEQGISMIYGMGKSLYDGSLVKKYEVNSIPLKIDSKKFPNLAPVLNSVTNKTTHINPWKLVKQNIGSNKGLCNMMREFQDDNNMAVDGGCDKYHTTSVDENIMYRILKVCCCFNLMLVSTGF